MGYQPPLSSEQAVLGAAAVSRSARIWLRVADGFMAALAVSSHGWK